MKPFLERFWDSIEKTPSCWIWKRKYKRYARSLHNERGEMEPARRIALRIHGLAIAGNGEWIATNCGNKDCVRPEHLKVVKHGNPSSLSEKFWPYVDKTDGCWIWKGTISRGRGLIQQNFPRKSHKAHRVSWILHNGAIPDGLLVCHKCDNGLCVNPKHLFLGTTQDNIADKVKKGRQYRGNRHHNAKLTFEKAQEIRKLFSEGRTRREMCLMYSVSPATIASVVFGELWLSS